MTSFRLPLPDGRVLSSSARPLIMGILNVTPDSFSDGGLFAAREAAIAQGQRMEEEGADIIAIVGASTPHGHTPVAEDEERNPVRPFLQALSPQLKTPISL